MHTNATGEQVNFAIMLSGDLESICYVLECIGK